MIEFLVYAIGMIACIFGGALQFEMFIRRFFDKKPFSAGAWFMCFISSIATMCYLIFR